MINDFTFLYGNNAKANDTFGKINNEMLLNGAKRIFGGREKVFFEYARDETFPSTNKQNTHVDKYDTDNGLLLSYNGNAAVGLAVSPRYVTGTTRYELRYVNDYCKRELLGKLNTFETKKYYSIDLSYILAVSRAMTDYDFSQFDGEGLRILKAWIFIMTYGQKHPDNENVIMLQSSKNEYGEDVRNRVLVRNSFYDSSEPYSKQGSPYGESLDDEWALSGDDYSKVAALDLIFTELSMGTSLYYSDSNLCNVINDSMQYGDITPEYLDKILDMQYSVNNENKRKK